MRFLGGELESGEDETEAVPSTVTPCRPHEAGDDSPPAPALSQGFGGDTDAIIGFSNLASRPDRWKEMVWGGEWRWSDDGEEGKVVDSHVAGGGEAEDVGVCRSALINTLCTPPTRQ